MSVVFHRFGLGAAVILLCLAFVSTGCGQRGQAASPAMPPANVSTVTLQPESVTVTREYAAQTFARDMVEVRARVDGYLERRPFEAGDDVRAGQVLYVLDLRPYEATVQKARADVA